MSQFQGETMSGRMVNKARTVNRGMDRVIPWKKVALGPWKEKKKRPSPQPRKAPSIRIKLLERDMFSLEHENKGR